MPGSASIESNGPETLTQPEWMNEMRIYCLLCDDVLFWKLISCKRYQIWSVCHEISGSNSVQMINPNPTAISSLSAAWLIYILSINIQMKMACLVTEIGMQTHIVRAHHFVKLYNNILSGFFLLECSIYPVLSIRSSQLSCQDHNRCVFSNIYNILGLQVCMQSLLLRRQSPIITAFIIRLSLLAELIQIFIQSQNHLSFWDFLSLQAVM